MQELSTGSRGNQYSYKAIVMTNNKAEQIGGDCKNRQLPNFHEILHGLNGGRMGPDREALQRRHPEPAQKNSKPK